MAARSSGRLGIGKVVVSDDGDAGRSVTAARAGQLRIGDLVRFDGQLSEVAGLDGAAVYCWPTRDAGR